MRIAAMSEEAPLVEMLQATQEQRRQQIEYDNAMKPFERR